MSPKEASRKENENKVWRNLYPEFDGKTLAQSFCLVIMLELFDNGYTQLWTEEVFKISKIQLTIPVTYKITDYNREEIQGSFYEQELQKTYQCTFRNEKVLKRQGDKSLVNGCDILSHSILGLIQKDTKTNYRTIALKTVEKKNIN